MVRSTAYHDEVLGALQAIGNPRLGAAIQRDRGSRLTHLGIGFPALRARVKQGFSFTALPEARVLRIWDALWRRSPYGDVLFAALVYVDAIVRKRIAPEVWPLVRGWSRRVDNWCHSDMLAGIYSRILEADFDQVYPQLQTWNVSRSEWLRRLSLTSLIHYTGKNAVFLPAQRMLPLVANCVDDHRPSVALAVGWILREAGRTYPDATDTFLERHAVAMSSSAFMRALERRAPKERARLMAKKKTGGARHDAGPRAGPAA
jgi:3-methyladenine DNA glycosylase AlkD